MAGSVQVAADEFKHFMGEPDHIWCSVQILRDWIGWDNFEDEDSVTAELEQEYAEASGSSTAA